ncbi:MAG: glutamate racemase [Bacteroidales bacterium]|nr:MAG: glutamate racemase [Bacteroidales bacterium]
MSDSRPIGVFDSGAGGLSVLKALVKELPNESFIYFADSANCPYGSKPKDEIIALSSAITDFLISMGCKVIVVACNTATAAAIDWLRENYSVPFIGMEPAIKPAALNTKSKSIGVLATAGTFKGRLYIETSHKYASDVNVCYQVGEGLVELVEQGIENTHEAEDLLLKYVKPMLECNIDQLVLGCTHYPFFKPLLEKILPPNVEIIDPSPAVAKQVLKVLVENQMLLDNSVDSTYHTFYSSGSTDVLKVLVSKIEEETGCELRNRVFFDTFIVPVS